MPTTPVRSASSSLGRSSIPSCDSSSRRSRDRRGSCHSRPSPTVRFRPVHSARLPSAGAYERNGTNEASGGAHATGSTSTEPVDTSAAGAFRKTRRPSAGELARQLLRLSDGDSAHEPLAHVPEGPAVVGDAIAEQGHSL